MSKESKLYLFRDRKDYIKKMTNDDVINVIGTKGSGKTTSTLKYINDDNYIVINCDRLYEMPTDKVVEDKYLTEIKDFLKNKYGKICEGEEFVNCYNDILDFIKSKKKKALIEGNVIYDIKPITLLKGTVIVKRTGIIKCFVRAVKRDYPIKYFMNQEIEKHGKILGRFYRLKDIIKRRLDEGITYCEFSYMLMQAMDFVHLYQDKGVTLQVAGSDQWGNITTGIELARKKLDVKLYGFTMPLILDSNGVKFGKTEGNALWLDETKTSSYELYQYLINTDDKMVIDYLKKLTFLTKEEIEQIEIDHLKAPEKRLAQEKLAEEVITFLHGKTSRKGFGGGF